MHNLFKDFVRLGTGYLRAKGLQRISKIKWETVSIIYIERLLH